MLSVENQLAWMPSTIGTGAQRQSPAQELALSSPPALSSPDEMPSKHEFSFFGDDGFSFGDLIDVVNPLHHIPFVSTFYREATGDDIAAAPRVMGSTLFFGPLGFAGAIANVMVEESTGMDIGQHMASWVGSGEAADNPVQTARNSAVPAENPAATQPGGEDPVVSWARGEADWAKRSAEGQNKARNRLKDRDTPPSGAPLPDADPLLRDGIPAPAPRDTPDVLAQMAVLSNDARSAARAYEVAANLRPLN